MTFIWTHEKGKKFEEKGEKRNNRLSGKRKRDATIKIKLGKGVRVLTLTFCNNKWLSFSFVDYQFLIYWKLKIFTDTDAWGEMGTKSEEMLNENVILT